MEQIVKFCTLIRRHDGRIHVISHLPSLLIGPSYIIACNKLDKRRGLAKILIVLPRKDNSKRINGNTMGISNPHGLVMIRHGLMLTISLIDQV